jgi:hypothetical protein
LFSIQLRQIQIQENQIWPQRFNIRGLAAQKRQCLLTVLGDLKLGLRTRFAKGFANQPNITGIILYDKDSHRLHQPFTEL